MTTLVTQSQSGSPDVTPNPSLAAFDSNIGSSPIAGQQYNLQLLLENLGSSTTATSGRVYVNNQLLLNTTLTLNPGSNSGTGQWWTPAIGTYTIRWVVDEENAIAESDETNNSVTRTVTVTQSQSGSPDVTPNPSLAAFDSNIGSSPIAGQQYNLQLLLENLGSSTTATSGRVYVNNQLLLNTTLTLNPGSNSGTGQWWTPAIGTYTIRWVVDEENAIAESDETNNSVTRTVTVTGIPSYSIAAERASVSEGNTALFTVLATNVAAGTLLPYSISGSGILANDISDGQLSGITSLGSNGQATIFVPIAADQTTEGNETLTVTVQGQSASVTIVDTSTTPAPTPSNPICFLKGTQVRLTSGEACVESLMLNQAVEGANEQALVKWIGRQRRTPEFAQFDDYLPVKICAGALEENVPVRDLYLSPDHAVLVDGHLIHAQALVNGRTIIKMTEWEGDIEYYHIETENHEIIFAEGVPCETLIDNVSREQFDNYAEYQALYPYTQMMRELPLPRVKFRRQMPSAIWRRLMERADLITAAQDQA